MAMDMDTVMVLSMALLTIEPARRYRRDVPSSSFLPAYVSSIHHYIERLQPFNSTLSSGLEVPLASVVDVRAWSWKADPACADDHERSRTDLDKMVLTLSGHLLEYIE